MKKYLLIFFTLLGLQGVVKSQCPPNAFAFTSQYPQCPEGCGVLLRDWPEGVIVNIYGGTPLQVITSVVIPGVFGGPGTGNAFVCVPCNIPLVFASAIPGATSGCVITYLGTVSVTLTQFRTELNSRRQPVLYWTADADTRDTRYTIQRSADGVNYTDLFVQSGQGGTNRQYQFTDAQAAAGQLQYRIKMTDASGEVTYSQTLRVKTGGSSGAQVYPNPTHHTFDLSIPAAQLPATVRVLNAQGQPVQVLHTRQPVIRLGNALPRGVYAVQVIGSNQVVQTLPLIKQ